MASRARIKVPETAVAGEIITIKTLISHRMESGERRDENGQLIPRFIIKNFRAEFNGKTFFSVEIEPAIAANPFLEFHARIDEAGTFTFVWTDDAGEEVMLEQDIALNW